MPSDSGFSSSLYGGIWLCHSCDVVIGQASDASRPVCPYCNKGFVEVISYAEGLARGRQSLASLDGRRSPNSYRLPSQGSVPDVGYPTLTRGRRMRWNDGECLMSPERGQWLQDSVDSHYGRRGTTPASNASMDAWEVVKVNGTDAVTKCMICLEQMNVREIVKPLPCGHLYHADCINKWFMETNSCPLCRDKMPRGVSSSGRRLSSSQTRSVRASMTMSEQAQGETSSRPASNTESVSGFLYDAPGNNIDVDYDGDVIMRDACS